MKKIGIDARLYFQTGVGVYLNNFLYYLQKLAPDEMLFYVYVMEQDASQVEISNKLFTKRIVTSKWHTFSEQTVFYNSLMNDHLDLMHFTYFSYPVLYRRPFVATIHDITPLVHKTGRASTMPWLAYELKHAAFRYVLGSQVKNAMTIITPTQWVKDQIITIFGKKYEKKLLPIYEGVSYRLMQSSENLELRHKFKKPFFLYVGNFYPHKNVDKLIEAFIKLDQNNIDLILVGPDNYFADKMQSDVEQSGIESIHFYHTGNMKDLVFFYKKAMALVNPSLSEGFGLPLVEAAYFDTPIIASDLPVFHELLGDSYLTFDPKNVDDITEKLMTFLKNPQAFHYPDITKMFSFEDMTKKIIGVYSKIF
ncbi:hypothetical protein A3F59_03135 [Candidatus Roizmanbacteria bacterium RIFCSPHIGHO2_12_FULL_38_13]|nr:MAG: hypothetical protein A3F59_03135 [Candidatus Roizmanbacteria bacterium RIFCSPHIGHO2_12_FULL_38_13]